MSLSKPFRTYQCIVHRQKGSFYLYMTLGPENACTVKQQIETNGGQDSGVEILPPRFTV
jgi:hypothetical protein